MNYSQYISFFKSIAENYKPISHTEEAPRFAILDVDDIHAVTKSKMDITQMCMVLEHPEGRFKYYDKRAIDQNMAAFHIIKKVRKGDVMHKEEVMNECKEAIIELYSFMIYQRELIFEGNENIPEEYKRIDLETSHYMKVGPVFDNCYGWRAEVDVLKPFSITINPSNWHSL